jgi:hypothetical protein
MPFRGTIKFPLFHEYHSQIKTKFENTNTQNPYATVPLNITFLGTFSCEALAKFYFFDVIFGENSLLKVKFNHLSHAISIFFLAKFHILSET